MFVKLPQLKGAQAVYPSSASALVTCVGKKKKKSERRRKVLVKEKGGGMIKKDVMNMIEFLRGFN